MTTIANKYSTFQDFWTAYRTTYFEQHKDLVIRSIMASISHINYHYWKDSHYEPYEGVFYGKFFGKMTVDAINYSRNRELYQNIFQQLKLRDKELFKSGSRTEHSKINKKSKTTPQATEWTNIPYTSGEDMESQTFGRAQLLKQQQKQLKTIEREETSGRRVVNNEDGSFSYQPTYDETTTWGDKNWLGRWLNALQYLDFGFDPKTYSFLFDKLIGARGHLVKLPSGRKKWISTPDDEEEEELPQQRKKKEEYPDITWEEWKLICQAEHKTPTQQNYYLECITRYHKRKEKEKAPLGSLTALGIEKQKELAEGLIKAWEKDLSIPNLTKFDNIMNSVLGFEEFKRKLKKYAINLKEDIEKGKKTKQTIFVLLGPPGIGKSFISVKAAEALDRVLINVDLGGRTDTGILEGVSPSVKAAFAGRICQGIAVGKDRGAIILLDEFEKVKGEALPMMLGNVLDIEKNKDWFDQFLGYRVDLSDAIIFCTANYKEDVPDFVQDRAVFIDIQLYSYQQRLAYVMKSLKEKLASDERTCRYANQLTEDFCKYLITETWGLRQTNVNMEEVYKSLRAEAIMGNAVENLVNPTQINISPNRFNLEYEEGQVLDLVRLKSITRTEDNRIISILTEVEWPDFEWRVGSREVWTK